MKKLKMNNPWEKYYNFEPLEYPEGSMYDTLSVTALKYPNAISYTFYGNKCTYKSFMEEIKTCAKGLKALGVKKGDVVSICMPNTPEAVTMFYAVNMIGAISNMIHPLSGEKEIEMYLKKSNSKVILAIDIDYKKVINIINNTMVTKIIIGSVKDDLKGFNKAFYNVFKPDVTSVIKKIKAVFLKSFQNREVLSYKKFIQKGLHYSGDVWCEMKKEDPAVILYSGGTSGSPKAVLLSNLSFNALAIQADNMVETAKKGDKILCIMPIFHGFGLGVCIHTCLHIGMNLLLIPTFKAKSLGSMIKKLKPNFLVGVPTLFEALSNNKNLKSKDLSSLHTVISGGDIMDEENLKRYNLFLKKHGSKAKIRVGYGLTEACAATCLNPINLSKENSIGIPFPNVSYKIVDPETLKEKKCMEDGEICISGPNVMLGYLNDEEETKKTLKKHKDGKIYLHTGDIGCMDKDGFVYFKSRLKRMIVSSGYNIYPSYIENILNKHEYVSSSSVIGVKDKYRGMAIKAFVVLKREVKIDENTEIELREHLKKYIARYSIPKYFEFKKELPKTLVGKIAYTVLEDNEKKKN